MEQVGSTPCFSYKFTAWPFSPSFPSSTQVGSDKNLNNCFSTLTSLDVWWWTSSNQTKPPKHVFSTPCDEAVRAGWKADGRPGVRSHPTSSTWLSHSSPAAGGSLQLTSNYAALRGATCAVLPHTNAPIMALISTHSLPTMLHSGSKACGATVKC